MPKLIPQKNLNDILEAVGKSPTGFIEDIGAALQVKLPRLRIPAKPGQQSE